MLSDETTKEPAALHIENNLTAWSRLKNILGIKHELPVWPDDFPFTGYNPQAVAITVKGKAEVKVFLGHRTNEVLKVMRVSRVGMVVGKTAINLTEKLGHLAAKPPNKLWAKFARHTIAGIYGNP